MFFNNSFKAVLQNATRSEEAMSVVQWSGLEYEGAVNYVLNTHGFIAQSYEKIQAFNLRNNEESSATWRPLLKSPLALELCSKEKHFQRGPGPIVVGFFFPWVHSVLPKVGVGTDSPPTTAEAARCWPCISGVTRGRSLGAFLSAAPLCRHKMRCYCRESRAAIPARG